MENNQKSAFRDENERNEQETSGQQNGGRSGNSATDQTNPGETERGQLRSDDGYENTIDTETGNTRGDRNQSGQSGQVNPGGNAGPADRGVEGDLPGIADGDPEASNISRRDNDPGSMPDGNSGAGHAERDRQDFTGGGAAESNVSGSAAANTGDWGANRENAAGGNPGDSPEDDVQRSGDGAGGTGSAATNDGI